MNAPKSSEANISDSTEQDNRALKRVSRDFAYENMRQAVVVDNSILDPTTEVTVVNPKLKNLHEYNSKSTCVMIDLMGPPYSDEEGRECHYFKPYVPSFPPSTSSSASDPCFVLSDPSKLEPNSLIWLMPDHVQFAVDPLDYVGPSLTIKI